MDEWMGKKGKWKRIRNFAEITCVLLKWKNELNNLGLQMVQIKKFNVDHITKLV